MSNKEFQINKDDFQFIVVSGSFRKGKTLLISILGLELAEESNIEKLYANFNLKHSKSVKLPNLNESILLSVEDNSIVCITEAYRDFNNRGFGREKQIKLTDALCELGKREITTILDSPRIGLLDNRVRNIATIHFEALGTQGKLVEGADNIFHYRLIHDDMNCPNLLDYHTTDFYIDTLEYMSEYDTKERIGRKKLINNWITD